MPIKNPEDGPLVSDGAGVGKAGEQEDRACGLWGPSAPHKPSWKPGCHAHLRDE